MRTASPGEPRPGPRARASGAPTPSTPARTRATGVCCSITSLTSTPHGVAPARATAGRGPARVPGEHRPVQALELGTGTRSSCGGDGRGVTVRRSCHGVARGRLGARLPTVGPDEHGDAPGGTRRPQVYWRRRVVALVVLVVVVGSAWSGASPRPVGALRGGDEPPPRRTAAQEPGRRHRLPATRAPPPTPSAGTGTSAAAEGEVPSRAPRPCRRTTPTPPATRSAPRPRSA